MNVIIVYEERGILKEKEYPKSESIMAAMTLFQEEGNDHQFVVGVINADEIEYVRKPYRASIVGE